MLMLEKQQSKKYLAAASKLYQLKGEIDHKKVENHILMTSTKVLGTVHVSDHTLLVSAQLS